MQWHGKNEDVRTHKMYTTSADTQLSLLTQITNTKSTHLQLVNWVASRRLWCTFCVLSCPRFFSAISSSPTTFYYTMTLMPKMSVLPLSFSFCCRSLFSERQTDVAWLSHILPRYLHSHPTVTETKESFTWIDRQLSLSLYAHDGEMALLSGKNWVTSTMI